MNPNITFSMLKMTMNLNYIEQKSILGGIGSFVQLRKIEQNTNRDLWLHALDYVAKFEMKVKTCANEPKYYVFNVENDREPKLYRKEINIRWDWIIVQLRKIEQNTNPDLWLHAPDYVAKFEMKVKTFANEPKSYVFNFENDSEPKLYRKEIDIRWDWIIVQLRKIEQNSNPNFWLHALDYVAKFEMKVKTCANEPKSYVFNVENDCEPKLYRKEIDIRWDCINPY
jgi:hypothetical protein